MTDGPIDTFVFEELAETVGADFVGELVTAFLDEAPDMIADLKDAAVLEDSNRFRRAAHSVKSNAEVFGARHLSVLAREMEVSELPTSKTATPTQLAALDEAYARAATALSEMVDG